MDPIRPIRYDEPAIRRVDALPRVRLLSPAEREEARRRREALRLRKEAQERGKGADHST